MTDEELAAAIREVQEHANARVPRGPLGLEGVTAPDLMPLVHARDAAESKVAAIGTVNPRPPGFKNDLIQGVKRRIARMMDWYVRDQIEFNRAAMTCVQASLEAITEMSRGMAALAAHQQQLQRDVAEYRREVSDTGQHWAEWRVGFEERRNASEIHMLRTISELQGGFQHRVTILDESFRKLVAQTHGEFARQLTGNTQDVQQRLWADLQKIRAEYDALIHSELRLIRQKMTIAPAVVMPAPVVTAEAAAIPIDWARFAEVFRGSEERIRGQHKTYAARFAGTAAEVLDLGCGRGEFLEAARDAGVSACGIDSSKESIALCRQKNLNAAAGDLFAHLASLPDRSLGGVFCSQVIEHLEPARLPVLVQLIAAKLKQGALAIFETPNPECLAIFATHFYIDPTHTRPVPAVLLRFYCEEAGMGGIEIGYHSPAVESLPALAHLPAPVRDSFFGALDYSLIARKL